MNPIRLGIVIIARDEEDYILNTLRTIQNQTIRPTLTILINDNSKDNTKKLVMESYPEIQIIDYPYTHKSYLGKAELSHVYNLGLIELAKMDLDYTMIVGADHILTLDYVQTLIDEFNKNDNLAIASGTIRDEYSIYPRGSGRLYSDSFLKLIGYRFPFNYGYESYHFYLCEYMGFDTMVLDTLQTETQRTTGSNYKLSNYEDRGKSFKALGYSKLYLKLYTATLNRPQALSVIKGYNDSSVKLYDLNLRKFIANKQRKQLIHPSIIKRALKKFI